MNATNTLSMPWRPAHRVETVSFLALLAFAGAMQISIAMAEILLAVALLGWAVTVIAGHERVDLPRAAWPLAAYAGWTLVAAAFSVNPTISLYDCKQLVLFLIVPATYRLARGERAHLVVDVIITIGAIAALVGIVQYGILQYDNLGKRPQGTLTHYMTYSGLLMLVIATAAARLLYRSDNRIWTALVTPTLLVALALTFTRGAWVGACVAVAVLAALRDKRLLALVPIAIVLFIALAPERITNRVYSMIDLRDPTNRDRLAMIRSGIRMVEDDPLTGVGPDQVRMVYERYRDSAAVQALNVHLHNVPMQIAAERGLPALVLWVWFVLVLANDHWRMLRSGPHPSLAATGLAAIVAMLAAGLFEYNFGDSEFLMLFLVLITLPYAANRAAAPDAA